MHSHSHSIRPPFAPWLGPRGHGRFAMSRGRGRGRRFGAGPFGFPEFGGHRGPRARRGDVRAALLTLLAEEPRNGYQLMQEIEQRSDGLWRPSPGSVYPALQLLQDEGLVSSSEDAGRRLFDLTAEGRAYVEARADELAAPWDAVKGGVDEGRSQLMSIMRQAAMAAGQILHAGSDAQVEEAKSVLADTRRSLYRILAEDEPDAGPAVDEA
jgi:DNA-binding PadR family transcriptional regulator